MRAACIGSRALTKEQLDICESLGAWLVRCGHIVDTGNAEGADQAFARGGNTVNPELVHLHLPWYNFNREAIVEGNQIHLLDDLKESEFRLYEVIAQQYHPNWKALNRGGRKLMIRNSSILIPPPEFWPVDLCLAWPSDKPGGGGTGQGMRIAAAEHVDTRLVDLRHQSPADLFNLCEEIRETAP